VKKTFFILMLIGFLIPSLSFAITYTFSPGDLGDLDHPNYYNWGINQVFDGSNIVSATLTFTNIVNLYGNPTIDILYLNLLDNSSHQGGISVGYDDGNMTNAFAGLGVYLAGVTTIPTELPPITYIYSFTESQLNDLAAFVRDGYFGIGIDPDCHYFNDGVALTINTASVPEPGTILLIGVGLIGVGIFGRKRFTKK